MCLDTRASYCTNNSTGHLKKLSTYRFSNKKECTNLIKIYNNLI